MSMPNAGTALTNPMKEVRIGKVVINMGVGKSGEPIERAQKVVEELFGRRAKVTRAKRTIRDFGIHEGQPIGLILTLRGPKVMDSLKKLLSTKGMRLPLGCFDGHGNCSFGVKEHIEVPGARYRPEIGIFGMDVSVLLECPGYRVMRRARARTAVGARHRVSRDQAISFFRDRLGVEVVSEVEGEAREA